MNCPQCGYPCSRDEVDIGIGTQYGRWECNGCGWYEGHEADAVIDAERDDDSAESLQLVGGPFDGETHQLMAQAPHQLGLPGDGGSIHWYEVHADIMTATYLRSEVSS